MSPMVLFCCSISVTILLMLLCCCCMASIANCRCCRLSPSCSFGRCRSLRDTFSSQPMLAYLQGTSSNIHSWRCSEMLHRRMLSLHSRLGHGTSIMGHSSRCFVVLSSYSPASLQWGQSYFRLRHAILCFSMSLRRSCSTCLHRFGQGTSVKSQLVKCSSIERSSPLHLQPLVALSHLTFSERISLSPVLYLSC